MRLAVISDIHANDVALRTALYDAAQCGVDVYASLGDVVGYGPSPAECVRLARDSFSVSLLGNHDAAVCGLRGISDFSDYAAEAVRVQRKQLGPVEKTYLKLLPLVWHEGDVAMAHGDFTAPGEFRYVDDEHTAAANFAARSERVMFIGHTHEPGVWMLDETGSVTRLPAADIKLLPNRRYIINPGTVGYPRGGTDVCGTYAIYDDKANAVYFRKVPFDMNAYSRALRAVGRNVERSKAAGRIRRVIMAAVGTILGVVALGLLALLFQRMAYDKGKDNTPERKFVEVVTTNRVIRLVAQEVVTTNRVVRIIDNIVVTNYIVEVRRDGLLVSSKTLPPPPSTQDEGQVVDVGNHPERKAVEGQAEACKSKHDVVTMPTKEEMAKVQPIVNNLMAPLIGKYRIGKMSASEVADGAMAFVAEAEDVAAKFILLRGAVHYYTMGRKYDRAADAVEEIMKLVPDIPPADLSAITSKAMSGASKRNAPRLAALDKLAKYRAAMAVRLKSLEREIKAKPQDIRLKRACAELLAATGDWNAALGEFAKLDGEIGKMAAAESDGPGENVTFADFWWSYTPLVKDVQDAIRSHAAKLYGKALDNGELSGLKKTLAAKRLEELESSNVLVPEGKPKVEYKFNYRLDDKGYAILCGEPCVSPKPEGVLVIPDKIDGHTVTKIDGVAFRGCDKMTRIVLPPHLDEIMGPAGSGFRKPGATFASCNNLDAIDIAKSNPKYTSERGVLYSKDKKTLIAYPKTRSEIVLVRECTTIGCSAFRDCQSFRTVRIPDSVQGIYYWVFEGCGHLEVVEFPKSFKGWLGAYVFERCKNLKKVVFHGDAPTAYVRRTKGRQNFLHGAPGGIVIEVEKGSRGWNGKGSTDLPDLWPLHGNPKRPIRYIQK